MSSFDSGHRAPPMPHRSDRLTFRRLRHPTPLPKSGSSRVWGRYLSRLSWLFS
ncbi:MAG TPA: hypothetical protein VNU71_13955 [Burkholderiaceae bacterium]|nr:hypothetical protein [Burkholderiaceae bacterium]